MRVGIIRERFQSEHRVALTPEAIQRLHQRGYHVIVEKGAGIGAFYPDEDFRAAGAEVVPSAEEVLQRADILLRLYMPEEAEITHMRSRQILIGTIQAWRFPERVEQLRARGITVFALERMPRISRAQSMDVLSSMASIAGYKAVIIAAERFGRLLPMMITAAGTIPPCTGPSDWGRCCRAAGNRNRPTVRRPGGGIRHSPSSQRAGGKPWSTVSAHHLRD